MAEITTKKEEKLWNSHYLRVWTGNFLLFFSFMLLTPLLPLYLSETFHATKEQIGMVLSGYVLTALIARALSGYVVDSFPRKTVLLLSYLAFALCFMGYIFAGSVLFFTIARTFHGVPFGAATVATSTVAIDVLPSSRRAEGIGFFGLSNNIATAIGPTIAIFIYSAWHNFNILFMLSLAISFGGFLINYHIRIPAKELRKEKRPRLSWDRFFLLKAWSQSLTMVCFAFSYSVISTYIAVYSKERFGVTNSTGIFFTLLAVGLILSRLTGSRSLKKGKIVQNASMGMIVSLFGYGLFALVPALWSCYLSAFIIGLGNGHMYPAFQNIFVNLAPHERRGTANSTNLVSWDVGMGLGMLAGGVLAQFVGYQEAFVGAWIVNACGVVLFFSYSRRHFMRNRLR